MYCCRVKLNNLKSRAKAHVASFDENSNKEISWLCILTNILVILMIWFFIKVFITFENFLIIFIVNTKNILRCSQPMAQEHVQVDRPID